MAALNPEQWRVLSPFLDQVLCVPENEREAWLHSFRTQRPDLVDTLLQLLENHRELSADHFLEQLPGDVVESSLRGHSVGAYKLLNPIGHGGMGDVWLAERSDGRFEKRVAVKLLRFAVASSGAGRFKREGRILAQLAHPNIAELLDAGVTSSGQPYLVLEHVQGQPITEVCDERKLTVEDRIRLFLDVLSAVARAHANLVVHRDIKPSNVLVSQQGQVKLLDFGIAKLLAERSDTAVATQLTKEGAGALTPQFAAPEQITGATITTATDVYALGVLLYLLLTGQHPLGSCPLSPAELVKAILDTEPLRPSDAILSAESRAIAELRGTTPEKLRRQLRGDLDTIVGKMLKKDSAERYSTVTAAADDLQRFLNLQPISARRDTFTYRFTKFARRNKLGLALTSLAVIATVTAIVLVNREARRAEARFQQVRKLAHTVLFDLNPEIEELTGSTKARESLVKTSLQYLDSLANEVSNDPGLQLELATAYEKIGDVQGNSKYSNLGHPEAALQSYGKAVAIARKMGKSPEALEVLASTYSDIGTIQVVQLGLRGVGRENLRLATAIADSIPQLTGKPDYKLRVLAYGFLGDVDEIYDPLRAAEPLRHSLELAVEWSHVEPGPEPRLFVAILTREKADMLWGTGDLNGARRTLLESLAIFDEALAQDPTNGSWARERVLTVERLGLVSGGADYFNLGDRTAAADWLQKFVKECEHRASDSSDVRARLDFSNALSDLATVYRDTKPQRAKELYERSLALSNSALQANPEDAEILNSDSLARIGFAHVLHRLGLHRQAMAELRGAVDIATRLANRDATNISTRQLLGVALHTRAHYLLQEGNGDDTEKDLQQSQEILSRLYQENPNNLMLLRDLADCYRGTGDLAAQRSDWGEAQLEYQKSLRLWEHWTDIGKSTAYDQQRRQQASTLERNATKHLPKHSS